MNKYSASDLEELKKLAKPLQEWLASHFNPMNSIIIEIDSATVISKEMFVPNDSRHVASASYSPGLHKQCITSKKGGVFNE